jgi:hypothetical protein
VGPEEIHTGGFQWNYPAVVIFRPWIFRLRLHALAEIIDLKELL